ncbi:DUF3397 domain-containing protein [Metabacillus litoralis]|uniref:DUF3397 domain-containing protein n=1 Tax=Metabacillus litoralis TaxID=152268 RepID=UPI001CFF4978|nr:DUF3397 domain-containing protein [Metabacillus litoralis]
MDVFRWVLSIAITLPLVSMIIMYFIIRYIVRNNRKTILWTADLTTIIFIASVHFHLVVIFEKSFLLYIILALIGLMVLFYYLDYKKKKVPSIASASKKVWRVSFFVFFISYLVLTLYGIAEGIIKNTLTI